MRVTPNSSQQWRFKANLDERNSFFENLEESEIFLDLKDSMRSRVYMVLDELTSNIIKYGGNAEAQIHIGITVFDKIIKLLITDDSNPFDPHTAPTPEDHDDIEDIPIGGRGLMMVREVAESFDYIWQNQRNKCIIALSKHTEPE